MLDDGALQPVIGLLSSKCHESQREAALLLGQFATAEPDYKAKIVQRGAVPPLIVMLRAPDAALKEMAAFALGRLAQNQDNQVSMVPASLLSKGCPSARQVPVAGLDCAGPVARSKLESFKVIYQ